MSTAPGGRHRWATFVVTAYAICFQSLIAQPVGHTLLLPTDSKL
jgi:hypothetical protein